MESGGTLAGLERGQARGFEGRRLVRALGAHQREMRERRIAGLPARDELAGDEALVVVPARGLDGIVLDVVALHDDDPAPLTAAGTAGDLGEKLEGALGGTKVGEVQACI